MKKFFTLFAVIIMAATLGSMKSASAQSFKSGDNVISAGIGLGGSYGLPISLRYEKGVYDINSEMSIGVGGMLGYGFDSDKVAGIGKWSYSNLLLGATGTWHFTRFEKLDLSAGLTLGYDIASAKWKYENSEHTSQEVAKSSAGGFLWGLNIDAKYYFTENFGAFVGVGYGLSYANVGVCYKF